MVQSEMTADNETMTLTFGTTPTFKVSDVSGYRITACLQRGMGFSNNFFVYAMEQTPAPEPLAASPLPSSTTSVIAALTISGPLAHIHFDSIMLDAVQTVITHSERLRVFRFRIQGKGGTAKAISAKFSHKKDDGISSGDLGDNYTFSVTDKAEPLLAFSASQTRALVGMRFVSLLGKTNSFFNYFVEQNNEVLAKGGAVNMKIGFPLAKDLDITEGNLHAIVLEESWGAFCTLPSPDLREVLKAASVQKYESVLEVHLPHLDYAELRKHANDRFFETRMNSAEFLQTATVVLANDDKYRTVPVI